MTSEENNRVLYELNSSASLAVRCLPDLKVSAKLHPETTQSNFSIGRKLTDARSFEQVLDSRRSERSLIAPNIDEISTILYNSVRVESSEIAEDGYARTFRPFASAGGRHPLEVICIFNSVVGHKSGSFYFDPFSLRLVELPLSGAFNSQINRLACKLTDVEEKPPVIFLSLAILRRTLSRYENGLSLVWRDTGNLFCTLSLSATALGLGSCQLGISLAVPKDFPVKLSADSLYWFTGGLVVGRVNSNDFAP